MGIKQRWCSHSASLSFVLTAQHKCSSFCVQYLSAEQTLVKRHTTTSVLFSFPGELSSICQNCGCPMAKRCKKKKICCFWPTGHTAQHTMPSSVPSQIATDNLSILSKGGSHYISWICLILNKYINWKVYLILKTRVSKRCNSEVIIIVCHLSKSSRWFWKFPHGQNIWEMCEGEGERVGSVGK